MILGLNEAISTARASGWITCFGLLCCPCSCGLTAMYLRNRTELALEAGQKFLQAHVNNTPLWTDVGVTWELQQVGLSLDVRVWVDLGVECRTLREWPGYGSKEGGGGGGRCPACDLDVPCPFVSSSSSP